MYYFREGRWRFQSARNVVVSGYAIETPRLLLLSANSRFRYGLANSSGLIGKNLTVQGNQAVLGKRGKTRGVGMIIRFPRRRESDSLRACRRPTILTACRTPN